MTEHVMSRKVFDIISELVDERSSLNPSYSGRLMYGDTCVALLTRDVSGLVRFVISLVSALQDVSADDAERVAEVIDQLEHGATRQDQLGHDVVFYWPQLAVDGG